MGSEKPTIILIQPRTGDWDYLGARIPESLLGIAAIPSTEGYNVHIIDQRIDKDWEKALRPLVDAKPLLICTTAMTGPQITYALELSRLVKSWNKDIPIIWGGLHPTMQPLQTISNQYIDILVIGEGETSFINLVHALEQGHDLHNVKGIVFKKDGNVITTPPQEPLKNLDDLPDLPYHLVDVKKYYGADFRGRPSIIVTTSRGCPYRCNFCIDPAVFKRRWQAYSADRVIKKMHHIVDTYGIKDFYFQDDNFATDPRRVKDILKRIITEFDDIAWGTLGIRADAINRMDDELLDLLEKSGCRNIDIGAESGSQRMLDIMKKDEKVEDLLNAARKLAKHNIILKFSFVMGFPGETEDDLELSRKLALQIMEENKHAYCVFWSFCPYLGTEAFDISVKHGFKAPQTLETWADFDFEGWYQHNPAWLTKRRQKIIQNISFSSCFASKNIKYKISSKMGKFVFDIYHPIAYLRFRYNIYQFPIERKLREFILSR